MLREAAGLIRARAAAAVKDPACWADVAYGLDALREALNPAPTSDDDIPPEKSTPTTDNADALAVLSPDQRGRADMIQDLQRRALAAESTHDPQVVQDLLTALTAFLDEELNEALSPQESAMAMPGQPDAESDARKNAAETDNFMKYAPTAADATEPDADTALNARRSTAEADGFQRYANLPTQPGTQEGNMAAERPAMKCAACGHSNAMPAPAPATTPTQESAALAEAKATIVTLETQLVEARKPAPAAEPEKPKETTALAEAERVELVTLRTESRKRQLRERAVKAIGDAEATGYVDPDELTSFEESQWPALLKRWGGPPEYGTGQREMPAPAGGGAARQSAGEFFEREWQNG